MKFRVRRSSESSQGLQTDFQLVVSKFESGSQNVTAGRDRIPVRPDSQTGRPPSPPGEGYSAFMLGTFLLDEKVDSVLRLDHKRLPQMLASRKTLR
jgi:hypothetical protein